jgi:hypothetical protein
LSSFNRWAKRRPGEFFINASNTKPLKTLSKRKGRQPHWAVNRRKVSDFSPAFCALL